MRKNIVFACVLAFIIIAVGCADMIRGKSLVERNVDTVQVALAGGNPLYGRDSKTITNEDEVRALVNAMDGMQIGASVPSGDVQVAGVSEYRFYSGDKLVGKYAFNANDTQRIWQDDSYYYVEYHGKTPYQMYIESAAEVVTVDDAMQKISPVVQTP